MAKTRPPIGMPSGIVLLATPDGYRHSVLTEKGGMICGRLGNLPPNADAAGARAAAAALVVALAHDVHHTDVDVIWDPPQQAGSWTAQVSVAAASPGA
ncbi:hypothetical protein OG885_43670 [Streptomyces sp. NBC_00028]|uniref:hypothetical protein n=1 Tax=Streptomyces sp. NBC_00028 TaxID=2975624 RepID=UPI00325145BF